MSLRWAYVTDPQKLACLVVYEYHEAIVGLIGRAPSESKKMTIPASNQGSSGRRGDVLPLGHLPVLDSQQKY